MSDSCSAVSSSCVSASMRAGSSCAISSRSVSCAHAVLGGDEHGGDAVGPVGQQVAGGVERERRVGRRAEAVDVAERGDADDRDLDRLRGEDAWCGRRRRGRRASAAPRSMTTSSAAPSAARRPSASWYGLSVGVVDPVGGRSSVGRRRRCGRRRRRGSWPTPSIDGTAARDAVDGGDLVDDRVVDEVADVRVRRSRCSALLRTTTSMPALASVNAWRSRRAWCRRARAWRRGRRRRGRRRCRCRQAALAGPEAVEGDVEHRCQLSEVLHAVEDAVGGGVGHRVDDAAVREEQHGVGVAGGDGVVGDHDDRLAELVDGVAHEGEDLAAGAAVEVAGGLVGEDQLRASDASARATATRCCWPPDSSLGRCFRRSPSPTVSTTVRTHSLVGLGAGERHRQGDVLAWRRASARG